MIRIGSTIMGLAALAVLAVASSAHAQANYVYGFSDGGTSGNYLTLITDTGSETAYLDSGPGGGGASGWYSNVPGLTSGSYNDNYITGNISGMIYVDFLGYSLSGITGTIIGGVEHIQTATVETTGTETVNFLSDSIPLSTLLSFPTDPGTETSIYNSLTNGSVYATQDYTVADDNTFKDVTLGGNFLTDINNAISGGASDFVIAHFDGTPTAATPLPSSLMGGALLIGGLWMSRKAVRRALI